MRTTKLFSALLAVLLTIPIVAAGNPATGAGPVSVAQKKSGSMQTRLSSSIVLNEGSKLEREAITIHDARLPVTIQEHVAVSTVYEYERVSGRYKYVAKYEVTPSEPLQAIEVKFLLFDVFGRSLQTLVSTDVQEIPAGTPAKFEPQWNLFSENEASMFYASIAYVSRVRTASGKVMEADTKPVIAEATKFSKKFTEADLEPKVAGK